ncbi:MAG TPA: cation:dicarboxylase symporter family transporter [Rhizomicrobium sp.]|nr:cation:dicarboxylase symporter family transporter [Rhizomicrobium sp.]
MPHRFYSQLWFLVLVATVAGGFIGWRDPALGASLKPLGDGFIALIRMMIAPVIFCSVVHGIGAMRDIRRAGRVALKAIVYFEVVTSLALLFAVVAVNLLKPGAGMHVDLHTLAPNHIAPQASGPLENVLHIIPTSFVGAFTGGDVLQILFVSVLFAFGLVAAGPRAQPVLDLVARLSEIVFRIVGFIMWAAPIGAFGAMAFTVGALGAKSLLPLAGLVAEFYAVCLLFVVVTFGLILRALGASLFRLVYFIRDELLIVAATTSTETVLPRLIEKLRALGCEETVAGLVVPAGYSFNLDGTCLYLATVPVFLAQATDTPFDIRQQLFLIVVLLLTSKGAAGVAGAALVALAATLNATEIVPAAGIALVLGVHRLLSEGLTFVNAVGNMVAGIVVAKWEGALDEAVLRSEIGSRRRQFAQA